VILHFRECQVMTKAEGYWQRCLRKGLSLDRVGFACLGKNSEKRDAWKRYSEKTAHLRLSNWAGFPET
jgi:hypothetical protein